MKRLNILLSGALVLVSFFLTVSEASAFDSLHAGNTYVRVVWVNDGDTVTARINGRREKVRLIGIDAPEMAQNPWGGRARSYLRGLLSSSGWSVRVEYDVVRRDKYGRLLAYVWKKDGTMMNEEMIKAGMAVLFTIPPNVKYETRFRTAEKEARFKKLGVWGDRGLKQRPSEFREQHREEREKVRSLDLTELFVLA